VSGADLMPTFLELAGAPTPGYADGRSLMPLLTGSDPSWRDALLLEGYDDGFGNKPYVPPDFEAIRTADGRTYVEYETGERGLYDLRNRPAPAKKELARGARTRP
jgi:N-acetylglucosamine-6-sulfatase